jgi:pimeloyl-ACP methyl ester carboxylesterase
VANCHLNGIDIEYEQRGSGPRLLLFNGSGGTLAAIAPLVDVLVERFEVLVHDQRCLGATTVTDEVPMMADYAADGAALLDHVGWPTALVMGISFGGMVAQEFAVTWPERVERLALLCTSPGGTGGSSYPLHSIGSMPQTEQDALRLTLMDRRYTADFLAEHPFDQMLVDLAVAGRVAPKSDERARGEELQLRARAGHDVWDRLERITCPTIVACGEFDALAPPENSDAIASRVAGSAVHRYQGGHGFLWQDRSAMPAIVSFLLAGC